MDILDVTVLKKGLNSEKAGHYSFADEISSV